MDQDRRKFLVATGATVLAGITGIVVGAETALNLPVKYESKGVRALLVVSELEDSEFLYSLRFDVDALLEAFVHSQDAAIAGLNRPLVVNNQHHIWLAQEETINDFARAALRHVPNAKEIRVIFSKETQFRYTKHEIINRQALSSCFSMFLEERRT